MRTQPHLSDDELPKNNFEPLPDGEYDFQVKTATAKTSAKGNEMLELVLIVWDQDGKQRQVWDYLTATIEMEHRIRHFCRATGLDEIYNTGNVSPADVAGASGRVILKTQDARTDRATGKTYEARNVVRDYVVPEEKPRAYAGAAAGVTRLAPDKREAERVERGIAKVNAAIANPVGKDMEEEEIPF